MQQNKDGVQRLFRQLGLFSLYIIFSSSVVFAGSFENFQKSHSVVADVVLKESDIDLQKTLSIPFTEFYSEEALHLYEKPKPKNILSAVSKPIKSVGPRLTMDLLQETNVTTIQTQNVIALKDIKFNFFGSDVGFNIDENIKKANFYPQNQQGIKNYYELIASSEYENILNEVTKISENLKLNDWGVYLLVKDLSKDISEILNNQKIFQWFILNKLGYKVKIALSKRHVVLLISSDKVIYNALQFTIDDDLYYLFGNNMDKNIKSLYSYYDKDLKAKKPLDFSLKTLPNFQNDFKEKKLSFKQLGKNYFVNFHYNKNLIDFMATYPQVQYDIYFNTPISDITYDELTKGLKKYVQGMQASRAINFILNFVQNAFVYETDQKQFGEEKVMFAEETLLFDKSDCEDRAILFANLIKRMYKIGVVGIKYEDHMATALYIPLEGDSVKVHGKRYILADPTYINANIGQSMPKYKRKKPQSFIVLKD